MRALVCLLLAALVGAAAATSATLPGVKTPTRNISCFFVPIKPTKRGTLLCDIERAVYLQRVQHTCQARAGLDWHGFEVPQSGRAVLVCSGGILYDIGRDTPRFVVLGYGRTWRSHGFTCRSRMSGLTCTNRGGHGVFISRGSYRLF